MPKIIVPADGSEPEAWLAPDLLAGLLNFERVVRDECGIGLTAGDSVRKASSHLLDLVSAFQRETNDDPGIDGREGWRIAVGLADLAKKVEHVSMHDSFRELCPHIRLLLEESAIVQNVRSLSTDSISNKLFELLIAASVMQFGSEVHLDHPDRSKGDNPDVLALVRANRWGFACKVVHSANLKSYYDNVVKAIDQIERSPADRGLVVINLKNVLPHDRLWPAHRIGDGTFRYEAWPSWEAAEAALESSVAHFLDGWEEAFAGDDGIRSLFEGRKAAPLILNYVHLTALVIRNDRPVLTSLRRIIPLMMGLPGGADALPVSELLSDAVQRP